jgi:hypothetical protein
MNILQQASLIAMEAYKKGGQMSDLLTEIIECLLLFGFMLFALGAMAMSILAKGV